MAVVVGALATVGAAVPASAAPVGVPPSGIGGAITAWGSNSGGQTTVPASLTGKTVTAISAGDFHSLALTADGTVTGWGHNGHGQTNVPASLTDKRCTVCSRRAPHPAATPLPVKTNQGRRRPRVIRSHLGMPSLGDLATSSGIR